MRSLFVLRKRFNQKQDVIDEKERRSLGGWRERGYGPEEGQCHFITHSLTYSFVIAQLLMLCITTVTVIFHY